MPDRTELVEPIMLRAKDAAKMLQIGESTLRRFASEGRLRAVRFGKSPRSILGFRPSDLLAFRDQHLIEQKGKEDYQ